MGTEATASHADRFDGDLSVEDRAELRERSLSAEGALARGECIDEEGVLAELDEPTGEDLERLRAQITQARAADAYDDGISAEEALKQVRAILYGP
jgi:hypothetical protein